MTTSQDPQALKSIFELADAWFVISQYLEPVDIAALSLTNKESNTLINHSSVWEQQFYRYFYAPQPANKDFKSHFRERVQLYGKQSSKYYKRVLDSWHAFRDWCASNLPQMLDTFNPPATQQHLNALKNIILTQEMRNANNYGHLTPYFILLGECCDGQKRRLSLMGMFGYYKFYNKCSSGHLLSILDAIKYTQQVHDAYGTGLLAEQHAQLTDLYLFCAGIPSRTTQISVPCLTFIQKRNGNICKMTQDAEIIQLKHCGSNSFMEHFEFYILRNLVVNNYRVHSDKGILRFPLKDLAASNCITRGILCRGSPLFIPEISNIKHGIYIFPYHIEIECASIYDERMEMKQRYRECPKEEYQLTIRKWFIEDNSETERVEGAGVIGLFPTVCVDQKLFEYESCSQQTQPNDGKMWGYFVFKKKDESNDTFEVKVAPYKLDWNLCQWI